MTDQIFSVDNTLTLVHTTKTAARRTAPLRSYFVKAARVAVENVEKQQRAKLVRQPLIEEISNNSKRKSTDTTEPFTEIIEDMSDTAFENRHRKHERAEKQRRLREIELFKHQMYKRQLDYEARLHKQINGIPEDPLKQRLMEEFEAEEAQVVAAATATVGSASSILQNEIEFVYRGREIMSSVAMETRLEALLDAKRVVGRYVNNYRIPIHERFTEDDFVESVRAPPPPSLTSLPSSSSVSLLEDQKDRPLLRSRSRLLDAAQHEEATPSLSSNNNAATTDAAANVGEGEGRAAAGPTLRRSSRNTTITSQSRPRRFQFSPPRTIKAADFETSALLKKIIENNDEQQHTRQRK